MAALNGGRVSGVRRSAGPEGRAGGSRGPDNARNLSFASSHRQAVPARHFGPNEGAGEGSSGNRVFGMWVHTQKARAHEEVFLNHFSAVAKFCCSRRAHCLPQMTRASRVRNSQTRASERTHSPSARSPQGGRKLQDDDRTDELFREADELQEVLRSQGAAASGSSVEAGAHVPVLQDRHEQQMSNSERLRASHRALLMRRRDAIRARHGAQRPGQGRVPIGGAGRKVTDIQKAPRIGPGAAGGSDTAAHGTDGDISAARGGLDRDSRLGGKTSKFFSSSSAQGGARVSDGPCRDRQVGSASLPQSGATSSPSLLADLPGFSSSSQTRPSPASGHMGFGGRREAGGRQEGAGRVVQDGSARQSSHAAPASVSASLSINPAPKPVSSEGGDREGGAQCLDASPAAPAPLARKSLPPIPRKK